MEPIRLRFDTLDRFIELIQWTQEHNISLNYGARGAAHSIAIPDKELELLFRIQFSDIIE